MGERLDEFVCAGECDEGSLMHDWDKYARHYKDIVRYIRRLMARHGRDGKDVAIEDLALRLARLRAGIEESVEYGK